MNSFMLFGHVAQFIPGEERGEQNLFLWTFTPQGEFYETREFQHMAKDQKNLLEKTLLCWELSAVGSQKLFLSVGNDTLINCTFCARADVFQCMDARSGQILFVSKGNVSIWKIDLFDFIASVFCGEDNVFESVVLIDL